MPLGTMTRPATELRLQDIPDENLGHFILNRMQEFREKTALINGTSGESCTFGDVISRSKRIASGLQAMGVKPQDIICLLSPYHIDAINAFFAAALINAKFYIMDVYNKDGITRIMKICRPKAFIMGIREVSAVKYLIDDVKIITFGEADGTTNIEALADPCHGEYVVPSSDPKTDICFMVSTSGSTGPSKVTQMSQHASVASILQISYSEIIPNDGALLLHQAPRECFDLVLPVLTLGNAFIFLEEYDAETYLKVVEKFKPQFLYVSSEVLLMLAKNPMVLKYDLSSVTTVCIGGSIVCREIIDAAKHRLNLEIVCSGYGQGESGYTHFSSAHSYKPLSAGKQLPLTETKIVNIETEEECSTNEEGELWVRGPQVFNGYLNQPLKTSQVLLEDGWCRTGDFGRLDEDGFLFISGREFISCNGYKFAPEFLEGVILLHDAVDDVIVIGVPHKEKGEVPKAFVKKAKEDLKEEEVIRFIADRVVEDMKLHGGVQFIDEIPKTSSGKRKRNLLKEQI